MYVVVSPAHLARWSWQMVSNEQYDGTQPDASDGLVRPASNGRLPPDLAVVTRGQGRPLRAG